MRFARRPRCEYEVTDRKRAAAVRWQRRQRDALPLLAPLITEAQPCIDGASTAALVPGTRLRTPHPLRFGRGVAGLFEVVPTPPRRRGLVFRAVEHGFLCRLRPEQIAAAERVRPGERASEAPGSARQPPSRPPQTNPDGDAP